MDTRTEQSIYATYRAALRSTRKNNPGMTAPERRQHARKVTVERHNLLWRQVKDLVAKYDAENGITHEHSSQTLYDRRLREFEALPTSTGPCPNHGPDHWAGTKWEGYADLPARVRTVPMHQVDPDRYPEFMYCCYPCYRIAEEQVTKES